jgi:uncharacterized protein (UPF0335 family)
MYKMFGKYWVCMAPEGEGGSAGGGGDNSASDTTTDATGGTTTSENVDLQDVLARLSRLETENQSLVADKKRAMDDIKKAQAKTKAFEEEQRKLKDKQAREEGNLQALLDQANSHLQEKDSALAKLQQNWIKEKSTQEALTIGRKLADPQRPNDAELLADLIQARITYDLETCQPKVLTKSGEETYATLDDLAKEIQNDSRFASLIKSSQRSGGGASGARGGASGSKQMTRAEYEALPQFAKAERMQQGSGWTLVD